MENFFNSVYQFFLSVDWKGVFAVARRVFIFLDVVLVIGFIFALVKALEVKPKLVTREPKKKKPVLKDPAIKDRWVAILKKSESAPPQSRIFAIIEADNFIDDVLKRAGLKGEHMADRLERLNPDDFKNLEKLWRAHRLRNELVHSPDFDVSKIDAGEILEIYESFLKEFGVLD